MALTNKDQPVETARGSGCTHDWGVMMWDAGDQWTAPAEHEWCLRCGCMKSNGAIYQPSQLTDLQAKLDEVTRQVSVYVSLYHEAEGERDDLQAKYARLEEALHSIEVMDDGRGADMRFEAVKALAGPAFRAALLTDNASNGGQ